MADRRVSQKGTKTKTRQATHGRMLATSLRCPECGCRQVMKTMSSNGMRAGKHWCANGHFFGGGVGE